METKERPIIFGTWAIPKIQDGSKTQTRRTKGLKKINEHPDDWIPRWDLSDYISTCFTNKTTLEGLQIKCPYGQVGDRLYVKETWRIVGWWEGQPYYLEYKDGTRMDEPGDSSEYDEEKYITYAQQCDDDCIKAGIKAQEDGTFIFFESEPVPTRWRPSIFMPRWASRIDLEITDIRVERLQNISREDVATEGCPWQRGDGPWDDVKQAKEWFANLWDSINGKKYPWDSNPWVWVISFRRIR